MRERDDPQRKLRLFRTEAKYEHWSTKHLLTEDEPEELQASALHVSTAQVHS